MKKAIKIYKASIRNVSVSLIVFLLLLGYHPSCAQPGHIPFSVTQNPTLAIDTISAVSVTCYGDSNGSATITMFGGYPPYTYLWLTDSQTTAIATGLYTGNYTVAVTDSEGCNTLGAITITQPALLDAAITISDERCAGNCDGLITATPSGGTAPYSFSWSNGDITQTADSLCAGIYYITIIDSNGCIFSDSGEVIEIVPTISLNMSSGTATCSGICDGTATVIASGDYPPFTYLWNDTGAQSTATATGLCSGNYSVTVTDAYACTTAVDSVNVIDVVPTISLTLSSATATCSGICDGTATVIASGDYPPFTYLWNDTGAQSTATATGLCSGNYSVTVTDAYACTTATNSVTVTDVVPTITTSMSSTDVQCSYCDGTATITATGTYTPLSYLWDDGQTTTTATGLCAGTHVVTVTDANACTTAVDSVAVNPTIAFPVQEICLITVDSTSTKNLIVWEKPITTGIDRFIIYREITSNNYQQVGNVPYGDVSEFFDISSGVDPNITSYRYKVSVLDSCGNESALSDFHKTIHLIVSKDINNNPFLQWDDYEGFAVTSYRILIDSTGAFNWGVLGIVPFGVTAYTDPNPPQTPFTKYIVEVVPPDTCTANKMGTDYNTTRSNTTTFSSAPLAISMSATDALEDSCDGSATVTVSGGISPYTFLWDDPNAQTNATATGLCPGTYSVTVTDGDGTVLTGSATVNEITVLPPPVADFMASFTNITIGTSIDFVDLSQNSPDSWSWFFTGGGPSFSIDQYPIGITYNTAGTYDVTLVATNSFGVDTLVKAGYIEVTSGVGIGETDMTNSLLIYPNPFTNATTVVFENEEQAAYELVLYDVLGNQVRMMENITTNEAIIEKGHLTPGVYFISLQGNGKALRGKLLVE